MCVQARVQVVLVMHVEGVAPVITRVITYGSQPKTKVLHQQQQGTQGMHAKRA